MSLFGYRNFCEQAKICMDFNENFISLESSILNSLAIISYVIPYSGHGIGL